MGLGGGRGDLVGALPLGMMGWGRVYITTALCMLLGEAETKTSLWTLT